MIIHGEKLVGFDIETTDGFGKGTLDPLTEESAIALIQMSYEDGTIEVLRPTEDTLSKIRRLVDEGYRFIIHNAAFELNWLSVKHGIRIPKVWCTMIASQVLNAGKMLPDEATRQAVKRDSKNMEHVGSWEVLLEEDDDAIEGKSPGMFSHSLQAVAYRYGEEAVIEKDQATSDWAAPTLTSEQIRYAEDDVRYLHLIAKNQVKFLERHGLMRVAELEMDAVPAVAHMKTKGILLDKEGWLAEAHRYGEMARELEGDLNLSFGMELAKREGELSLFGDYIPKSFKASSPTQVARFFGLEKANESLLRSVSHPLIPDLLKYKEYIKISNTYGDNYIKFIRPDGRIHGELQQSATATGRFSSSKPNNQNLPPKMLKTYLIADPGKIIAYFDYSAVESRILAYASGDEAMIRTVNSDDVHWENAKKIFHLPDNAPRSGSYVVSGELVPGEELRRKAKGVSFGIPYGISKVGLVNRGFAEDEDEGEELISNFLAQYPEVDTFLKQSVFEALTRGFTQDVYGRIRWYELPKFGTPEEKKQAANSAGRQAQNHKIQSTSASITKRAIVDSYEYLEETGYGDIILTVHDSLVAELDLAHAGEAIKNILRLAEEAGPKVMPGIVTPVDVDVGKEETRTCVLTGLPFTVFTHYYEDGEVYENTQQYTPQVHGIVKNVPGDKKTALETFILKQDDEWRSKNKRLVAAVGLT